MDNSYIRTNRNTSIDRIIAFLIVVFSSQFLTGITQLSPIYFAYILAFALFLLKTGYTHKIYYQPIYLIIVIIVFYLFLTQDYNKSDGGIKDIILKSMELIIIIIAYESLIICSLSFIKKIILYFINGSIIILFIDFLYRYQLGGGYVDIYSFKENSLMFLDSNFSGLLITCIFSLSLYFQKYYNLKIQIQIILLFVLVILTFSRASIIACIFAFLLNKLWNGRINIWYILLSVLSLSTIIFILENYFISDGSLLIRLNIIEHIFDTLYTSNSDNFLYGLGLGNTKYVIGKSAHNIILTYLMEIGIVGLLLYIILWTSFIIWDSKVLFVFFPVLINLMAVEGIMPYFYISMLLIVVSNKKLKNNEDLDHHSCV